METTELDRIAEAAFERCRQLDAPLSERLRAYSIEMRRASPRYAEIVDALVARLADSGAGLQSPDVGEVMTDFLLPSDNGRLVGLSEMLEAGPVVVAFFRGHWCPYCLMSAGAVASIYPEIRARGADLVAITPEVGRFSAELKGTVSADFRILSDIDNTYALELGLVYDVGDQQRAFMEEAEWGFQAFNHNEAWLLPIPALFVVGMDGRVRSRFLDPDFRHRPAIEAVLSALG